eukprot:480_1
MFFFYDIINVKCNYFIKVMCEYAKKIFSFKLKLVNVVTAVNMMSIMDALCVSGVNNLYSTDNSIPLVTFAFGNGHINPNPINIDLFDNIMSCLLFARINITCALIDNYSCLYILQVRGFFLAFLHGTKIWVDVK